MPDRIVNVERDPTDRALWDYGLADANGRLGDDALQLRHADPLDWTSLGDVDEGLWPTVILLVRRAGGRDRVVYNLTGRSTGDAPDPPPRGPQGGAVDEREGEAARRDAQAAGRTGPPGTASSGRLQSLVVATAFASATSAATRSTRAIVQLRAELKPTAPTWKRSSRRWRRS